MEDRCLALAASVLLAAAAVMPLNGAAAADYPSHAVTLIAPYPPGGGVDVMARLVGERLSAALGRQVVIENRGGAGGLIGTRDLAKSAPDGYTLGMMLPASHPGYDVNKDFSPVGLSASTPILIVDDTTYMALKINDLLEFRKLGGAGDWERHNMPLRDDHIPSRPYMRRDLEALRITNFS